MAGMGPGLRREDEGGPIGSFLDQAHNFALARSRKTNFWILPVEVFGKGPNSTVRGTLKRARWSRQNAMMSSAAALASGFRVTNAQGVSPHIGSGRATTAASST